MNPPGLTTHLHVKVGGGGEGRGGEEEHTHSPTNPTRWILTWLPNFKILSQVVWKIKILCCLLETFAVSTQAARSASRKLKVHLLLAVTNCLRIFNKPNQNFFCWNKFLVSRRKDNDQPSPISCSVLYHERALVRVLTSFLTEKLDIF